MPELIEAYWPYLLIGLVIGLLIAWAVFVVTRKTSVATDKRDVLDEGAAPAARNQALIDAPAPAIPLAGSAAPSASELPAEPVAAPEEVAQATPVPAEPAASEGDDLTKIKGLGPKLAALLNTQGITRFEQIAQWDDSKIDEVDTTLGRFQGRIRRDNWVDQAKLLAEGQDSEFSAKFGSNL